MDDIYLLAGAVILLVLWHWMHGSLGDSDTNYGESKNAVLKHPYEHL